LEQRPLFKITLLRPEGNHRSFLFIFFWRRSPRSYRAAMFSYLQTETFLKYLFVCQPRTCRHTYLSNTVSTNSKVDILFLNVLESFHQIYFVTGRIMTNMVTKLDEFSPIV
jgi:hypothetical protein